MKNPKILLGIVLLLLAIGFGWSTVIPKDDFSAFKREKLRLEERSKTICLNAVGDSAFLPDNFFEFRLTKKESFDLDGDGVKEDILLKNGRVNVSTGPRSIWQSPDNWWVDYFLVGDCNNDGTPELNMLVWKEGSFGKSKPFWVTEEDKSIKNHLFIFKLKDGAIKPVWQSSNLDNPNYYIEIADINKDGENELIAIEGSYMIPGERRITHWKWNGWGFYKL